MKRFKPIFLRILKDIKSIWPGVLAFAIYYLITHLLFHASCPLLLLCGLPCPGCGLLRCITLILTFKFANAWWLNPVIYAWVIWFIAFCITRYILNIRPKWLKALLGLVILITLGRYIYGMINWYPNRVPYTFRHNNLLSLLKRHAISSLQ